MTEGNDKQEFLDELDSLIRPFKAVASPLQGFLNELHAKYKTVTEGEVASYIPELAKVDPELFAICVVTVDGQIFEVGDIDKLFTIQSASKPFVHGLTLEDCGREYVLSRVGVEPTGDAFNAIILDERSGRPYNPMVNAGAIATAGLVKGTDPTDKLNRVLDMFRRFTGRDVYVDMSVYTSERTTGHRNRAIAHLMLNFGMVDHYLDDMLDLYFKQCSVMINCRDLAIMGATLANNGVNPVTRERALDSEYVKDVLSVMYTCGMYDYSGEWAYRVGLPAKSGVGGGIVAVVPKLLGIGVFSPRLDARGNSIRGVKVCEEMSSHFGLHSFDLHDDYSKFLDSLTRSKPL
ncbi:MAG: glutaminase A [Leptolyngbyaceae cyanobacterium bins.349]|nr:glutaminase A [Leptolyngbyaceae cyanobacterium bins.349]